MKSGERLVPDDDQYWHYLMRRSRLGDLYRRHWLYPKLAKHLNGQALDIGCGIGDMLRFRPNTVGVDINGRNVAYCQKLGLKAQLMKPDELPFLSDTFDSVLLDNVFEHVAKPTQLLEEVKRVVKFNGVLIVGVPGLLGWKADSDHKIFYNESTLIDRIEKHGFIHRHIIHMPFFKSNLLSAKLRQYCIYVVFRRVK